MWDVDACHGDLSDPLFGFVRVGGCDDIWHRADGHLDVGHCEQKDERGESTNATRCRTYTYGQVGQEYLEGKQESNTVVIVVPG